MEERVIKNAVQDYFAGQATPLQKKAIELWLKDPDNHEQYYQWIHDWESSHLQAHSAWEAAFDRTQRKVEQDMPEKEQAGNTLKITWWGNRYRMIAAILIFAIAGALIFFTKDLIFYQTISAAFGETKQFTLPDGSKVTLNSNSSLRIPRFGFNQGSRLVELSGEADFEIRHMLNHRRFVVITSRGLNVEVLGTQFTVFDRPRRSQVTLRTGKVALQVHKGSQAPAIIMKPGDLVIVDNRGKLSQSHTPTPERYASWKDRQITLDRTSLEEIAATLEEIYGFQVEVKGPDLTGRTATGLLPTRNPDTALELIAVLFDINFTRHDNKVIFRD